MAWAVATKMAPATYAVRTTIVADGKGRIPTEDELKAWTAAHERLFDDPQFMQLAAERCSQRGIKDLSNAPAVAARLKSDFSYHTDAAGKLTFELRGQGAERTTRELETLTLAAVATANAQREARGDGAATAIESPPTAGSEPISDQRMLYVATVGGGGLLLTFALWLLIYRLLAASKIKFEKQLAIES
jgi:hypothetical protein